VTDNIDPIALALSQCAALPIATTLALFARYGYALDLDPGTPPELDPEIVLEDGITRVGRLRFRARVDVMANDHFVLHSERQPASAMPGPLFAAAIAAITSLRARAGRK